MKRFNHFLLFSLQLQMKLALTEMRTFGIVYAKITDWTPAPKALNIHGRPITLQAIEASTADKIFPFEASSGELLNPGTTSIYLGIYKKPEPNTIKLYVPDTVLRKGKQKLFCQLKSTLDFEMIRHIYPQVL